MSSDGPALVLRHSQSTGDVIQELSVIASYIKDYILAALPPLHATNLAWATLPTMLTSLLQHLRRTIPTSLTSLPPYLKLVSRSVRFEEMVAGILPPRASPLPRSIDEWAVSLPNHYEKKRRELVLQDVRNIVTDEHRLGGVRVEKPQPLFTPQSAQASEREVAHSIAVPVNGAHSSSPSPPPLPPPPDVALDQEEEDGWGFDDLDDEAEEAAVQADVAPVETTPPPPENESAEEADPWDDDPWGDPEDSIPSAPPIPTPPVPKSAKGLEKFSKTKGGPIDSPLANSVKSLSTSGKPAVLSPAPSSPAVSSPVAISEPSHSTYSLAKETFIVSECAQAVLQSLRETMQEAQELSRSRFAVLLFYLVIPC